MLTTSYRSQEWLTRPGRIAVVFDLDGVLIDSFGVMKKAFALAYAEVVGDGEPPFDEYVTHLGRYFPDIMEMMGLPPAMQEPLVRESFRLAAEVTVFPGVRSMLSSLVRAGVPLAVATGKAGDRARSLLDRLDLLDSFHTVIGSDEVPRAKPAPDIVELALARLQCGPATAVMVGDAPTDIQSARAAGVASIAALWGEADPNVLLAAEPEFVAHRPVDVLEFVPGFARVVV